MLLAMAALTLGHLRAVPGSVGVTRGRAERGRRGPRTTLSPRL